MRTQHDHRLNTRQRRRADARRWLAAILLLPLAAYAAVPGNIDYRGYLTDDAGVPLTGTVSVTFRIYDALTAGALLWEETQGGIVVNAGRFDAVLGSVNSLQDDPDIEGFDRTLFLGLAVDGGAELSPRLALPGSAFSFAAAPTQGRTRVDCAAGSVAQALARAPAGGRYVIEIVGDCNESLTITRDRTTLRGIGGARLLGISPSPDTFGHAVAIGGARRVEIDALVIEPGPGQTDTSGILTYDNASFSLLNGSIVRSFTFHGVRMFENSSLLIKDSTVTGNGTDGVGVFSGSFAEGVNATVTDNGDDGFDVWNNSSLVLRDSTVAGNGNNGLIATLGSSLALDGNTRVESSAPNGRSGRAILLLDRSVLRASGGGNQIVNTVPVAYVDDAYDNGGGFALDVERNSSARLDRGSTAIDGWVYGFNLSTIDIRDSTINGHLWLDGLETNIRFRNQGSSILNGNVRVSSGTFAAVRAPSSQAVLINGFVDCRGNFDYPGADFADADDGYIDCPGVNTDLALTLDGSADPVSAGNPVTYTTTLSNLSSAPYVQATDVTVDVEVDGLDYRVTGITPGAGSCSDPGIGSLSGTTVISCDVGSVGPGPFTVDLEVISDVADTLSVFASFGMSNFDQDDSNDSDGLTTTVLP